MGSQLKIENGELRIISKGSSHFTFSLDVLIIAVRILIISLMSSLRGVDGLIYSAPMSNLIQYSVSLASFRAMGKYVNKIGFGLGFCCFAYVSTYRGARSKYLF